MPTVTADMLARLMDVDFDVLRAPQPAVADLLDAADEAHVTCPRGHRPAPRPQRPRGHRRRRRPHRAGRVRQPAVRRGLHRAGGGEGTVARARWPRIGLVQGHPAHLTVEGGRPHEGHRAGGRAPLRGAHGAGEQGTNLAELGVGTNERARLTGNILEDEKILGTVHVAFGASAGIGGTVSVPIHLDVVSPTRR
jgi:leucyl aminopeptidase (aminopeptidase T)